MRIFLCAMVLSAAVAAGALGGSSEVNLVRTQPHVQAGQVEVHQVIVKLRRATDSAASASSGQPLAAHERVAKIATRSGLTLKGSRAITDLLHVVQVEPASADDSVETTVEHLQADAEIEYAVADQRRFPHAVPNDTLYASGQWYEQNGALTPAAVDAQDAWDITGGDPNLVIADLDSGVRFDHPDLLAIAAGGRLLPGYDFISNPTVANDGDGWDPDASDPGDWVTSADVATKQFKGCTVQISSWHGTRTAGLLGALTNNAHGIAGMTWKGRILPVRVLGKCGGYDSDIITGMMWAAGFQVSGAPTNPTPARIINMSLGATGDCLPSYSDAITQITATGVLVVVSAGNEGGPVDSPANCPGVVAVAGIRHAGTKVGFSSLGPQVTVSAPAGNCVNVTGNCVYSIQTTTNAGTMGPVLNDDSYTGNLISTVDQPNSANLGTSFSAPIVSGIAALMASVNSNLNTCQLASRLKEGSTPFPQSSPDESPQPPMCHPPANGSDMQSLECICTNDGQTCGAGMANAFGAVKAAQRPIAAVTLPSSVSPGQPVTLSAKPSLAANEQTLTSYQWTSTGQQSVAIQNSTSATATVTAPSCGFANVQVAVSDAMGRTDTANIVLSPTNASTIAPSSATLKACSVSTLPAMVAVCPAGVSLTAGSGPKPFTASFANTTNTSVTWSVNNVPGGNSTWGTISSTGVYTAPATAPPGVIVQIQATSATNQSVMGFTNVTVNSPGGTSSGGGGGLLDPITLLADAAALGTSLVLRRRRRYARRCAASNQDF
jgi:serine protease